MPERNFYDDAMLYDILHAPGTAEEVDGLERIALRFAPGRPERQVWLDPACGTGRYLRVAAGRGRSVIGVDLSPAMIEYARRRVPGGRLLVGDMQHLDALLRPASVHFAFNMINTIRHLLTDDALALHLRAMARVLVPGGVYAVGWACPTTTTRCPARMSGRVRVAGAASARWCNTNRQCAERAASA